jgi:hypothetical protein
VTVGSAGRSLSALLLSAAVLACGRPAGPEARASVDLVAALSADPARLPAVLAPGTPVVLVLLHFDGNTLVHESEPIVLPHETLALERALAARRDTQPPFWAVQALADGTPRYWTPVDPIPKIRVSLSGEGGGLSGGRVALDETIVALRFPFFPESVLRFYDASGKEAGAFRFGVRPEIPLTRIGA